MGNFQVYSTKVTLNITPLEGKELTLNKGEVVQGLVREVKSDGTVSISIKGRLLEAASEVAVNAGQQILLQVDDFRDGKAYLKIVLPETPDKTESLNIAKNLELIGIKPTEENIMAARSLLHNNQAVTRNNISTVIKGAALLGETSAGNCETAAVAVAGGLSLEKNTLEVLKTLLTGENNIAQLAEDMTAELDSLETRITSGVPNPSSGSNAGQISSPVIAHEEIVPPNPTDLPTSMISEDEPEHTETARIQISKGPPNNAVNSITDHSSQDNSLVSGREPGEAKSNVNIELFKHVDLLKTVVNQLKIEADQPKETIAAKLPDILLEHKDIIKALNILKDIINRDTDSQKILSGLLNCVDSLEKEISGQKLINYINRPGSDNSANVSCFSFPVQIGQEFKPCELRINREPGKKNIWQQDQIKFIVSLQTKNLGMVLFHVNWNNNKELEMQGAVERQDISDWLDGNIDSLTDNLAGMGYQVKNLGIKVVSEPEEIRNLRATGEENSGEIKTWGIDVTV